MNKIGKAQHTCVVCSSVVSADDWQILNLGLQPLANQLLETAADSYAIAPLGLSACSVCGHGQLTHFVDPKILFTDYVYQSGTSTTLRNYFSWFTAQLHRGSSTLNLTTPAASVLELACNDGSLLDALKESGFESEGIDPARNLVALARDKGHTVYDDFFPSSQVAKQYDVVIAMNVLAHTPNPQAIMGGIAQVLKKSGVALIQTSQANMLQNGEFDTIYHEHYSFFTASSLKKLAEFSGLKLESVFLVSVHGTSFVFVLRHHDYNGPKFPAPENTCFSVSHPGAEVPGLSEIPTAALARRYREFRDFAQTTIDATVETIAGYRSRGYAVALVGVAAKSLTFLNAAKISPDYYFDEAELKVGKFIPGRVGAIRALTEVQQLTIPTVFVIGAWNFADELCKKVAGLMANSSHNIPYEFVVYFPQLKTFTS